MTIITSTVESEELGNGFFRNVIHMKPIAYRINGSLVEIDPTWSDSGNSEYPHIVSSSPLMIQAAPDGILRWHPTRDIDVYLEIGDPVYRVGGDVRTFDFTNPIRNGNRIRWNKTAASLIYDHGGDMGKMGLLFHNDTYQGIDNREFAFPFTYNGLTRSGRNILAGGNTVMRLRPFVAYDLDDGENIVHVPHEFRTIQGQEYVVVTLPIEMDSMSRPVLDPTLDLQPDGTSGVDTYLNSSAATTNYGTNTGINLGESNNSDSDFTGLIKFDLSSLPDGATITSGTLSFWLSQNGSWRADGDEIFRLYRVKESWVESEATWNVYSTGNSWQTAGCKGANDRESTDVGSGTFVNADSIGDEQTITISAANKADLDLGDGWNIEGDSVTNELYQVYSSDHTTAAERPKLSITYTESSGVPGASMYYRRLRQ